jgi:tetratricopeptide (TPR) repeat protein
MVLLSSSYKITTKQTKNMTNKKQNQTVRLAESRENATYFEDMARHFIKAVRENPGIKAYRDELWTNLIRAGSRYEEEGNKRKAEACYRLAIRVPNYEGWGADALLKLNKNQIKNVERAEAMWHLREAIAHPDGRGESYARAAELFEKAGLIERAREASAEIKQGHIDSAEYRARQIGRILFPEFHFIGPRALKELSRLSIEQYAQEAISDFKMAEDPRGQLNPKEIVIAELKRLGAGRDRLGQLVVRNEHTGEIFPANLAAFLAFKQKYP